MKYVSVKFFFSRVTSNMNSKKKEQEFVIHRKKNQLVSKSLSLSSSVSKHQRSRLARLDGPITGTGS